MTTALMAMVLVPSAPHASVSPTVLAFMLPICLVWAPQAVRRDRRTIAAALVLAVLVLGIPVFADEPGIVIANPCVLMPWLIECWFPWLP